MLKWIAGLGLVAVLFGTGCIPSEEAAPVPAQPAPVSQSSTPTAPATPVETTPAAQSEPETPTAAPAGTTEGAEPSAGDALAALATLDIKGRAPKTGYDRAEFGQRWADIDHNGCDQRNDILARDMTNLTYRDGTRDCVVETGTLADPFTGTVINFQRGEGTSNAVQIDHVLSVPAR